MIKKQNKTEKYAKNKQQGKENSSAESETYTICMLGLFLDHFAMSPVIHKGNKIIIFNSLSPAPRAADAAASTTKKENRKKLRYFRLLPNLAHRKLIALANYVPSSSPLRVLSFTQRFFKNVEKWRCVVRSIWDVFA